jgi:signal transduction histidine kinase
VDIASLNGTQVLADRNELEALLLILLSNALDAIVASGEIAVRTMCREKSVEIAVADTGPGISEADQARIFEPFFTTKPVGIGTGLGLAIANNIVHEHGGAIRVASAVGKGTTMTVELPVWRQNAAAGGAA